jgi:beta-glucosidase
VDGRLRQPVGLIYVDFDTLERIPKLSAEWFREAARQNAVV